MNVRFTFNRTPLKLMHRALEIGYRMVEENTLASLNLNTHLDVLLGERDQGLR